MSLVRVDAGERSFVELECCAHGARFDPATGPSHCLPAIKALGTAQVRVNKGRVELGVSAEFPAPAGPR